MKQLEFPPSKTVEEYFSRLPDDSRAVLMHLRGILLATAPEAEEVISYRMPALRYKGILVYYAAFSDHFSLFIASPRMRKRFARELRPYKGGKGTVRFTAENPLPDDLVVRIVRMRMAENEARAAGSGSRKPSG